MRHRNRQLRHGIATAILGCIILLLLPLVACEPGPPIKFTNQTDSRVTVYQGGELAFELGPGESRGIATLKKYWTPEVKVVSEDGEILLEEDFSWDRLDSLDWEIVITDPTTSEAARGVTGLVV